MKLLLLNITLLLFFGSNIALAETIDNRNYSWEEKPEFEVPVTEEDFSEVTIKHKKVVEFIVEDQLFMQYDLSHRITYIANETGVEDNNKVYLSTGASGKVVFQKARVINSKGEIIEFNDKDIKEGEDEQSGYKFKYFALDGLDIGSFVEVIFLTKKNASYSGSKVTMQSSVPKRNVEFELISPSHLEFAFLSTNGLPEVKLDTTIEDEDKNHYRLVLPEMEEHKYEELSFGRANLQSIIYKLDANTANGSKNMSSYADVVKNFFSYMYDRDFSKADVKGIEALIKKASIKDDMSTTAKVEKFDFYVK